MRPCALIIAIENYGSLKQGFDASLPGTNNSAVAFRDWLIKTKGVDAQDIIFCAAPSVFGRTTGTTRAEIKKAILEVQDQWREKAHELYVFYSGHGFFYTDTGGRVTADVLVASDFEKLSASGDMCIKLGQIQTVLRMSMGPGDHYYFVDACRNEIKSDEIDVSSLGITPTRSHLGDPTIYTLYATERGRTAPATSGFSADLVEGLGGAGHAKIWKSSTMAVLFNSLKDFLKQDKNHELDSDWDGPGDGLILKIQPPPKFDCNVTVVNAEPTDVFDLVIKNAKNHIIKQDTFSGSTYTFSEVPDEYYLTVTHPSEQIEEIDQPPADLYDPCDFRFRKTGMVSFHVGPPPLPPPVVANVDLVGAPDTTIRLRNVLDGTQWTAAGQLSQQVPPGRYEATLNDVNGSTIGESEFRVAVGKSVKLDLGARADSTFHRSVLARLPQSAHTDRTVDFSESLGGPISDNDPAVWLSLLGASRIVGDVDSYSKLGNFRLQSFADVSPGESPLYVLAGFSRDMPLQVRITNGDGVVDDPTARPVEGIQNMTESFSPGTSGANVLWLRYGDSIPLAIATYCLPNRATFVSLSVDEQSKATLHQFLLPIHGLEQHLDPEIQSRLYAHPPLATVRCMTNVQRRFANYKEVAPEASSRDHQMWEDFLNEKWFDPIMAIIACYELIRRGGSGDLQTVVNNLRQFFPGLPDTESIASLSGLAFEQPAAPPFLLDGVLAFEQRDFLPISESRLDFRGPWTTWRAWPG